MKLIDLTGQKIGRLTVIKRVENDNTNHTRWLCKCNCGKIIIVSGNSLRTKATKSCGCLAKELLAKRKTTHKMSDSRIYYIWKAMKQRCFNSKCKEYENYGRRGITICDEWLKKNVGFINFYEWSIKNGYKDNLSIDRIDVNGNYEPSNCRWATREEQSNNKRTSHYITYNNKTYTMKQWSKKLNINYDKIRIRIKKGLPKELWFYPGRINKKMKEKYNMKGDIKCQDS